MRPSLIITSIATLLLFSACSNNKELSVETVIASENLEKIKSKKTELEAKQGELAEQLQALNQALKTLDTNKRLAQITTFSVAPEIFTHYIELQGSVNTKQNVVITPEFSGLLTKVFVKEGQRVTKGQQLALIDDNGLNQQLDQLKIQAALSKTTFERQARLWEQKIGSEIQYLRAKSNYEAQEKAVKTLQSQLAKSIVRAPFSGTIDDVITEQGNVVATGQSKLFRLVNLNNMYIETDVPEYYIASITKNKSALIEFPILGKTYNGTVRQTSNYINPNNRTFKVEVAVPNKDKAIKPNLTAKLKINDYSNNEALLIPQSVISENAKGQQYIYIVENIKNNIGTTKRLIIETGKTQDNIIEVISGLKKDMKVIKEGARSVKEGQEVEIINS